MDQAHNLHLSSDMVRTLVLAGLLLAPRLASAQEPDTQPVQELFFTELVYPQEKGEWQLTLGARIDRARREQSSLVPFTVEYGITDRWQIEAGWNGYSPTHGFPFTDLRTERLSIGTKYSLMNIAHSHVHAAFGTNIEFPRAGVFPGSDGEMEIEPFVAMAGDLPGHITIFGSAGASFQRDEAVRLVENGERPDDHGTLSAGALCAIHWATLAAEYSNRSDQLDGAPLLTPSIVFHPPAKWEVGIGFPIKLRGRHQAGVAVNLVKEFD